mmetsp:Transcript_46564/g.148649  ORF Transcript_46564/g.148649 Transcript_46564/m.148649 type:complete len:279 (+) Transcript_46564:1198-2034(+)
MAQERHVEVRPRVWLCSLLSGGRPLRSVLRDTTGSPAGGGRLLRGLLLRRRLRLRRRGLLLCGRGLLLRRPALRLALGLLRLALRVPVPVPRAQAALGHELRRDAPALHLLRQELLEVAELAGLVQLLEGPRERTEGPAPQPHHAVRLRPRHDRGPQLAALGLEALQREGHGELRQDSVFAADVDVCPHQLPHDGSHQGLMAVAGQGHAQGHVGQHGAGELLHPRQGTVGHGLQDLLHVHALRLQDAHGHGDVGHGERRDPAFPLAGEIHQGPGELGH